MAPAIIKWVIVFLSLLNSSFMAFDGIRGIVKGDYVRPAAGKYAGQLGPWAKLVSKIGIDPESTLMKSIFISFGLTGLVITVAFALNVTWASNALLIFCICCLWYFFAGTISCLLQILLIFLWKVLS